MSSQISKFILYDALRCCLQGTTIVSFSQFFVIAYWSGNNILKSLLLNIVGHHLEIVLLKCLVQCLRCSFSFCRWM